MLGSSTLQRSNAQKLLWYRWWFSRWRPRAFNRSGTPNVAPGMRQLWQLCTTMTIVTITTRNSSACFQGIQHLEWGTMRLHAMNLLVGSRKSPYITNIQAICMRIKHNQTMFQWVIGSYHSRTCPLRTQPPGCSGGTRRHCYQSWCVCVCLKW